ncbi:hypothetical protein T484DRAFT_1855535 [Baffinella frigidus]|nr:hypothetical protein T484DRAFT_1855535 [Cryptophyta sp. CCMP2293]
MAGILAVAAASAATKVLDPCWLVEKPPDDYICQVCMNVLQQPTSGCPEGHCYCKECYVKILQNIGGNRSCPSCRFPTNVGKLVRCRPLENLVGMLQRRCANAVLDASELPPVKRARTEEHERMTAAQLRKKLVQEHGLKIAPGATRKEDFLALLKQHHASGCGWVGAISGLSSHLAADCMLETVPCLNAGCRAKLQRRDLENHGMYCDFRQVPCRFSCGATVTLASRASHEYRCMKATGFFCSGYPVFTPSVPHGGGCNLTGTREEMIKHQETCPDIKVACGSPGCVTRCKRSAMRKHMEEACETHVVAAKHEMERKQQEVEGLHKENAEQKKKILELRSTLAARNSIISTHNTAFTRISNQAQCPLEQARDRGFGGSDGDESDY